MKLNPKSSDFVPLSMMTGSLRDFYRDHDEVKVQEQRDLFRVSNHTQKQRPSSSSTNSLSSLSAVEFPSDLDLAGGSHYGRVDDTEQKLGTTSEDADLEEEIALVQRLLKVLCVRV